MRSCAANSQSHTPRRIRNYFKTTRQLFTVRLVPLSWKQKSFLGYHFFSDSFFLSYLRKREKMCVWERERTRETREGVDLLLLLLTGAVKLWKPFAVELWSFTTRSGEKRKFPSLFFFLLLPPFFYPLQGPSEPLTTTAILWGKKSMLRPIRLEFVEPIPFDSVTLGALEIYNILLKPCFNCGF